MGRGIDPLILNLGDQMERSTQFRVPSALPPVDRDPVTTEQKDEWPPEPVDAI
jgi:hypothetical protein